MNDEATILAVDDTSESLALLVHLLTAAGYQVRPADSGELALAAVAANPPDLILLDINMEGMDGLEVCQRLKTREETRDIPILLMSATAEVTSAVEGLLMGAADYISKPFHAEELLARVRTHLCLSQASATLKERTVVLRHTNEQLQSEIVERRRMEAELHQSLDRAERSRRTILSVLEDQKRAKEALRESQARLNGIVDTAMDAIVTTDDQERIVLFNAAAEQMFGRPAVELIGQPVERVLPARFRNTYHEHIQGFGRMDQTPSAVSPMRTSGLRARGLRADGEEFPIEASVSSTQVDGHILVTAILRDLTEKQRIEEQRAQMEGRLHQAQKLEALGTLAGGIAHDFNNIIGIIIGNTELARQDVGDSQTAAESLDEIRKASVRAKALAQRILAFASQHEQPHGVMELGPIVTEAVTLLRSTLPARIEIVATLDADAPSVRADPTQVHQILINLCTNSWHAMEERPGRIDIRLDAVTLNAEAVSAAAAVQPGRFARLSVTDTGTGMDAATLDRIFEPFFTTKAPSQGTGLGLSVVHGMVKAHGGTINVTSRPGKGSTFTMHFPAAEAPAQSAAPVDTDTAPLAATTGKHVLYLDDEESLVLLAKRMLERLGYRVSGCACAAEALAAVRADPGQFDLVVTDFSMPGMSGLDVAAELARLRPDLPVVLTSGYVTDELRAQARDAGVREVVYKPNTVEELCAAVSRTLDAKEAE